MASSICQAAAPKDAKIGRFAVFGPRIVQAGAGPSAPLFIQGADLLQVESEPERWPHTMPTSLSPASGRWCGSHKPSPTRTARRELRRMADP
jgi:hypothetical protein